MDDICEIFQLAGRVTTRWAAVTVLGDCSSSPAVPRHILSQPQGPTACVDQHPPQAYCNRQEEDKGTYLISHRINHITKQKDI